MHNNCRDYGDGLVFIFDFSEASRRRRDYFKQYGAVVDFYIFCCLFLLYTLVSKFDGGIDSQTQKSFRVTEEQSFACNSIISHWVFCSVGI